MAFVLVDTEEKKNGLIEFLCKKKLPFVSETKAPRDLHDYNLHQRLWALFKHAFDCWDPEMVYHKGQQIEPNFNEFRKDVLILAGHYEIVIKIDGTLVKRAKSISYSKMGDDEKINARGTLYSRVIDVILERILISYTKEGLELVLDKLVNDTLEFDKGPN